MNTKILLLSIIILPIIDSIYLKNISSHYQQLVYTITKEPLKLNMTKAIITYIFLIIAINYFILNNLTENNYKQKIIDAFILGLVIYGTFDFTSGALFKDYDYKTAIIDTIWGGILFALTTVVINKIK